MAAYPSSGNLMNLLPIINTEYLSRVLRLSAWFVISISRLQRQLANLSISFDIKHSSIMGVLNCNLNVIYCNENSYLILTKTQPLAQSHASFLKLYWLMQIIIHFQDGPHNLATCQTTNQKNPIICFLTFRIQLKVARGCYKGKIISREKIIKIINK